MAHDAAHGPESEEESSEKAAEVGNSLLNRRSYMKLSAAAAAAMGTAAATGTAAAATSRHGISFDRVVNAVDDLGWDPGGNQEIDVPTDDGLLIEVPAGEYVFRGSGDNNGPVQGDLQNWGIRGLGDDPSDVVLRTSNGESTRFINSGHDSEGLLVENLTFDNTDDRTGGDIGNALRARDKLEVHDVDHVGFSGKEPHCRWSMFPMVTTSGGTGNIVNYTKTGPSVFVGHGDSDGGGGVFGAHEGRLNFKNCTIANQGGDGGLYTGKHDGEIIFDGCHFENNDMAVIRTAAGSELRNCTILMDWDNAHPDNVLDDDHQATGTNAIYFSSAEYGKSGGGIYNCDIAVKSTYRTGMGGILINNSDGYVEIHDTLVQMDVDNMPAIWCRDPANQRLGPHKTPEKPWGVDIRNVSVTGSGDMDGEGAITLDRRHGSTIADTCVQVDGNADGIRIRNANNCKVTNTNVNVGGRATVFGDSSVDTSGISQGDSCPMPSMDGSSDDRSTESSDDADDSSGSEDSDDSNDSNTGSSTSSEHQLEVVGDGDYARYRMAVTGGIESLEDGEESPDGASSVTGHIAGGLDTFRFTGAVESFEFETGTAGLRLDGETVTPQELVEQTNQRTGDGSSDSDGTDRSDSSTESSSGSDGSDDSSGSDDTTDTGHGGTTDGPHELVVLGSGDYARYSFSVSGDLRSKESGEETPTDGSVTGHIASGTDPYEFTGEVTAFEFETGAAEVYLDGEQVDPQSLIEADGLPENTISVVSASEMAASYRFTVDGSVVANPDKGSLEDADNISDKSAEGAVAGGTDSYRFSGSITDFDLQGDAAVYVNGTQVSPELLGTDQDARLRDLIVVDGTGADGRCDYEFSVDGHVAKSLELGTVEAEDTIADGAVTGTVEGERDAYRFTGTLTGFDMDGSATLRFQTN